MVEQTTAVGQDPATQHREQAEKAVAELQQLLAADQRAKLAGARGYRALVLLARLRLLELAGVADDILKAPDAHIVSAHRQPEALQEMLNHCDLPDGNDLCQELIDELGSGDDPSAAAQPVLLAIEAQIGVLELLARVDSARELARSAAAIVAVHPEPATALGARAELQLAGLPLASASAMIWEETLAASVWLAAESLDAPSVAARSGRAYVQLAGQAVGPAKARPALSRRLPMRLPLPAWQMAAAAALVQPLDEALRDITDGSEVGSIYADSTDGRLKVCIPIEPVSAARVQVYLVLRDAVSGEEYGRTLLPVQRSGAELIADLGDRVGPASVRHKLLTGVAANLPDDQVQFLIEVEQDV